MVDFESQSACTLLALAGRRNGIDCARCDLAFARLGSAIGCAATSGVLSRVTG